MTKLYSKTFGERGCIVRVYEPRGGANFMIAPRIHGKYHAKTLGHRDEESAKKAAYALIAAVQKNAGEMQEPLKLTVRVLVDLYLGSETFAADLKPRQQAEKTALLRKIVAYFGPTKRVMALDQDSVKGLLHARKTGTHGFSAAGQQAAYNCFSALRSVILWALVKKTASGTRVLTENPILGMSEHVPPNPTPVQPIISHETFNTIRRGARRKVPLHVRVFLILAEGTGRRAGAIRALEWEDVLFGEGEILWRAKSDKMGLQMSRAASVRVMRYLAIWKRHCPSEKWVFPSPKDPRVVVPKVTIDKWTAILYNASGLRKPPQSGWHSFRRKWATERDGYSVSTLMQAGGWASSAALTRYLKTDRRELTYAIQNPTRRV